MMPHRGLALVRSLVDRRGMASADVEKCSDEWLDELVASNTPAVVLDFAGRRMPGVSTIEVDFGPVSRKQPATVEPGPPRFAHVAARLT